MRKSILLSLLIVVFCGYMIFSLSDLYGELSAKKEEKAGYEAQTAIKENSVDEKKDSLSGVKAQELSEKDMDKLLEDENIKELYEDELYKAGYGYGDEMVFVDKTGN